LVIWCHGEIFDDVDKAKKWPAFSRTNCADPLAQNARGQDSTPHNALARHPCMERAVTLPVGIQYLE